jgi:hypothetical protein
MTVSTSFGTAGLSARGDSSSVLSTFWSVSANDAPSNGGRPVTSS